VSWEAFTDDDPGLTVREDGPEAVVQRRELAQRLEASLAALSFHERQLVVLSDIHGLSYVEIAESTGRPVGTVKSRLSRARSKLREALRNDPAL
jgi:RNA polymerase sigma-70 factor (ECF subfamily)